MRWSSRLKKGCNTTLSLNKLRKRLEKMANEQNLIPAQKGEIRNPNGRPKGIPNSKTRLLRLLELVQVKTNPITGEKEEFTVAEQLDMMVLQKAFKGDLKAYQEILDRLEGRAKQTTDINANIQGSVQIVIQQDERCKPIED